MTLMCPSPNEVHLWPFALDTTNGGAALLLAADERDRAERFRFERDRSRYVVGRSRLRRILAGYLSCEAAAVELEYNAQGKPELGTAHVASGLHFNLAHSDSTALLAVRADVPIGVDLEFLRPGFADDSIAERFFAPEEVTRLRALPLEQQEHAFFRCWTRKEAYLKACGGGLQIPLDSFMVEFEAEHTAAISWVRGDPSAASRWTVVDVSAAVPQGVAAIASERAIEQVTLRSS